MSLGAEFVVYRLYDAADVVIYVGMTQRLKSRLQKHRTRFRGEIAGVDFDGPLEYDMAGRVEIHEIRRHRPKHNRLHNTLEPGELQRAWWREHLGRAA